jgi:hypothetical protein
MWRLKRNRKNFAVNFSLRRGGLLIKLLVFMIVGFIAIQLYVLTSVGTQGEKLSQVRQQQSEVKIQNEIIKARILELQSNPRIQETVTQKLQLNPAEVIYLEPEPDLISAQDN